MRTAVAVFVLAVFSSTGRRHVSRPSSALSPGVPPEQAAGEALLHQAQESAQAPWRDLPPGTPWSVQGDGCFERRGCIMTTNYPQNYSNFEMCRILFGDTTVNLTVVDFKTERNYDELIIYSGGFRALDGDYSGTNGPQSGHYGDGSIDWSTDGSVTNKGWKICVEIDPNPNHRRRSRRRRDRRRGYRRRDSDPRRRRHRRRLPIMPAPTGSGKKDWVVHGDGCFEQDGCVMTTNYPGNYGNNETCHIIVGPPLTLNLTYVDFITELGYDNLTINRKRNGPVYSGRKGPPNGDFTGEIYWSSDGTETERGWKICRRA